MSSPASKKSRSEKVEEVGEEEEEEGELVAVSAEVIDTDDDEEDDDLEEDEEEEECDPSQLLEINQEEVEEWDSNGASIKKEEPDDDEDTNHSRPLGLLEQALTMRKTNARSTAALATTIDPLEDSSAGVTISPSSLRQQQQLRKRSLDGSPSVRSSTYPTVSIEARKVLGVEERRSFSQVVNSKPRYACPICGDRANGIHYGIYTCEGCKNFFKRSVVSFSSGKPYLCRGSQNCNISLFEEDGITRRRTRCQYCRYKACLDAGMLHIGRNGRQIYSQKMAAAGGGQHLQQQSKVVHFGSSSPIEQVSEEYDDQDSSSNHYVEMDNGEEDETADFQSPQQQQQRREIDLLNAERMQNEIDLLHSRVRELEGTVTEKTRQLGIQRGQIANLQKQLDVYEQMYHGGGSSATPSKISNGDTGGRAPSSTSSTSSSAVSTFPTVAQFGNGSVTITSIGRRSELGKDGSSS